MVQRRIPKVRDLAPLLQFKKPDLNARRRRLASAYTIEDLRRIAKLRTPKAPFDYTDGAAEGELSLDRARQAFQDIQFHPAILRYVSHVFTSTTIICGPHYLPFGCAPQGLTTIMPTTRG